MAGAHTNPYIQSLDEQFSAELADLGNDIWLNAALFQRVNSVYEQRDALALDSESYRLLTLTWQRFLLAHAGRVSSSSDCWERQKRQPVVDYRHQLAGLSDEEIAAAADAAREEGLATAGC